MIGRRAEYLKRIKELTLITQKLIGETSREMSASIEAPTYQLAESALSSAVGSATSAQSESLVEHDEASLSPDSESAAVMHERKVPAHASPAAAADHSSSQLHELPETANAEDDGIFL